MVARSRESGGGTSFSRTSSVPVCGGMIRGRLPGIGEKKKYALNRDRNPLLELNAMCHINR